MLSPVWFLFISVTIFLIIIQCLLGRSIFSVISDNRKNRDLATQLLQQKTEEENKLLAEDYNFPLATLDCSLSIQELTDIMNNIEMLSFILEGITPYNNSSFFVAGVFESSEIIPNRNSTPWDEDRWSTNTVVPRYYNANMLVQKNEDNTITLYGVFPENRNNDLYLHDLLIRLKEQIERRKIRTLNIG